MGMHIHKVIFIQFLHVSPFAITLSKTNCAYMKYVNRFSTTSISLYYFPYIHAWVTFLVPLSFSFPLSFFFTELSTTFSARFLLFSVFFFFKTEYKYMREERFALCPFFRLLSEKFLECTSQLINIC